MTCLPDNRKLTCVDQIKVKNASAPIAPIEQAVGADGADDVDADNGNDSDVDSLFGDISDLNDVLDGAVKDDGNNAELPAKEETHNNVNPGTKSGDAQQAPGEKTTATTEQSIQAALTTPEHSPGTPQRPPPTPPRIVNVPLDRPPNPRNLYGPENHNDMPGKPDTPLADELRANFWDRIREERKALSTYKKSFKEWNVFVNTESNKTKADYDATAERLKTSANTAQDAWTKLDQSFRAWQAANPAVVLIIANVGDDVKSIDADEKAKAERVQFISEISGKSAERRRSEQAEYDKFAYLMSESRERERWRKRVATQLKVQAMIEAERQAAVDEQNRIAAEAERKKVEAEAEALRKKEAELAAQAERERKQAEAALAAKAERERIQAEVAERRRQAEAKAAEASRVLEEQLTAVTTKALEEQRREAADEERRQAEAAAAAEKLRNNSLLQNQSDNLAAMAITAGTQEQGQQGISADLHEPQTGLDNAQYPAF